jgi:acyl-CoA synthetase (AMP-forming)/AMP-acid ligase II
MNIDELLSELEKTNKIIISDSHNSLTGNQLTEKVRNLAENLSALGIKNKRICLLRMSNNIDSVSILLAALLNKAVVFVANPHDPITKVCKLIDRFAVFSLISDKATALFLDKKTNNGQKCEHFSLEGTELFANLFPANDYSIALHDQRTYDADIGIFSSGSTGEPKAILHKIESVLLNALLHSKSIDLQESDKIGICLPLYYSYGLVAGLLAALITKSELCLQNQIGLIDINWLKNKEISVLNLTPYLAKRLTEKTNHLRTVTIGGDILYSKQAKNLLNMLPQCNIYSTYGLTEAGPRVATCKIDLNIIEKNNIIPLGKPLTGVLLSLGENDSNYGELLINTPTHMLGYFLGTGQGFIAKNNDNQTVESGDLYAKKHGKLYFIGRKRKIIIQGGEKIFPLAIESAIHEIDGILEVQVSSISCKEKGQIAKAYIVTDRTLSINMIKKTLMLQFPRSLIPDQFEFVDSIPRSITGKILGCETASLLKE